MKNQYCILALATALFVSCTSETQQNNLSDSGTTVAHTTLNDDHHAQNSLDWNGTYQGTTPCADCEGIENELTLNPDHTYILKTVYKGKEMNSFEEKGTFKWDETGSKITLAYPKENPYRYFVGENTLTQLDSDGKMVSGNLAQFYVLKKVR